MGRDESMATVFEQGPDVGSLIRKLRDAEREYRDYHNSSHPRFGPGDLLAPRPGLLYGGPGPILVLERLSKPNEAGEDLFCMIAHGGTHVHTLFLAGWAMDPYVGAEIPTKGATCN